MFFKNWASWEKKLALPDGLKGTEPNILGEKFNGVTHTKTNKIISEADQVTLKQLFESE